MNKPKLGGMNFVRAVCAIGMICFHYSCHSATEFKPVYQYANGDWGGTFVTVFFILSGALLYYNYANITSLKKFYFKRFLSIYPAFWLGYLFCYIQTMFETGLVFWSGSPVKLWKSVLGIDGYLHFSDPADYYIIGEWFLGAIIMLYVLYPLLAFLMNKLPIPATIVIAGLYFLMLKFGWFPVMGDWTNPISCVASFWVGMLLMKYEKFLLNSKVFLGLSVIGVIVGYFVPLPGGTNLIMHAYGTALFVVLYTIGKWVERPKAMGLIFSELGALSYPIFLLQHRVIIKMLFVSNPPEPKGVILTMIATILVTIVYAKALAIVTDYVMALFRRTKKESTR